MDRRPTKLDTVSEEGWHLINSDWWHTPFHSISWAYSQDGAPSTIVKPPPYHGALFRGTQLRSFDSISSRNRLDSDSDDPDLTLNPSLCGLQCALDVITPYEAFVGILSTDAPQERLPVRRRRRDISLEVREDELALTKRQWDKAAEDLLTTPKTPVTVSDQDTSRDSSPSSSPGELYRSISTLSSVDLTDSDISLNSISRPSTPKGKAPEAIVRIKDSSPVKSTYSGRPLNASASSFIPSHLAAKSDASYDPASQPHFAFPSLEVPPAPSVKLRKDDQGFYSKEEVEAPVPETIFLPPFLQKPSPRRKTVASKTRAIIDRFRSSQGASSHCPSPNPPLYDQNLLEERVSVSEDGRNRSGGTSPSSLDDDGEGWVNVSEASSESKVRQTRNLFLAFTRRRSGSSSPNQAADGVGDEHKDIEIPVTSSPPPLMPPIIPYSAHDGWVEGLPVSSSPKPEVKPAPTATRRAESHSRSQRRRRSSHAPPAPVPVPAQFVTPHSAPATVLTHQPFLTAAAPSFPAPAPYMYTAYPAAMVNPMAYTSYMTQLQLQMQHLQMHKAATAGNAVRGRRASGTLHTGVIAGDYLHHFPTLAQQKPFTTTPMPPLMNMNPPARRDSLW